MLNSVYLCVSQLLRVDVSILDVESTTLDSALNVCFSPTSLSHLLITTSANKILWIDTHTGQLLRQVKDWSVNPFWEHLNIRFQNQYSCTYRYLRCISISVCLWRSVKMAVICWRPVRTLWRCGTMTCTWTSIHRYVCLNAGFDDVQMMNEIKNVSIFSSRCSLVTQSPSGRWGSHLIRWVWSL